MEEKLQFQMTEKEYSAAARFRDKKLEGNKVNIGLIILIVLVAGAVILWAVFGNADAGIALTALALLDIIYMLLRRRSDRGTFRASPFLNSTQLITFGEGIEFTNSFEKIFCPKFNVFAAGQKDDYLFIIATPRKGCFCINKERYKSKELENLISSLKAAGKIEGE